MRTLFIDCETHLITPTRPVPKLVCTQYAFDDDEPTIVLGDAGRALFHKYINDSSVRIVAHYGFFDVSVFYKGNAHASGPFIRAIDEGRYRDTIIMAKLHAIQHGWMQERGGQFSLSQLHKMATGVELDGKHGPDVWRLRYAELENVPLAAWPQAAIDYAKQDITALRTVYRALDVQPYADEIAQTRKNWDLKCAGDWGVRTDPKARAALAAALEPEVREAKATLAATAFYRPRPAVFDTEGYESEAVSRAAFHGVAVPRTAKGRVGRTAKFLNAIGLDDKTFYRATGEYSQNKAAIQALVDELDAEPLLTKKGAISTSRKVLKATGHPMLALIASIGEADTILRTFIPAMTPDILHPNHNPLVASGRVSVSKPNLNNMPRRPGVREVLTARPGYAFVDADYQQAELCGLAQICLNLFGYSRMAEAINAGLDLHCAFGADLLEISYEAFVARYEAGDRECADARQLAKCANFGLPGGLGVNTFITFAWDTYGVRLSQQNAKDLKAAWLATFPEIQQYFNWVNRQLQGRETFTFVQHGSGRIRGGLKYCNGCNTGFQGITADGATRAMRLFNDSALYDPTHPAYGARIVVQIYDQLLVECPVDIVHETSILLRESMLNGMNMLTPDVPAKITMESMYKWTKKAKTKFVNDRLVPFDAVPDYSGWANIGIGDSASYNVQQVCENHRISITASAATH